MGIVMFVVAIGSGITVANACNQYSLTGKCVNPGAECQWQCTTCGAIIKGTCTTGGSGGSSGWTCTCQ